MIQSNMDDSRQECNDSSCVFGLRGELIGFLVLHQGRFKKDGNADLESLRGDKPAKIPSG